MCRYCTGMMAVPKYHTDRQKNIHNNRLQVINQYEVNKQMAQGMITAMM